MAYETITLAIDEGFAILTLNRPTAANAMNRQMAADLRAVSVRLYHDPSVRAVLLTSEGKVFCAGGDLAEFSSHDPVSLPAFVDAMTTGFWVSVGFIAVGLATSLLLLPKQARVTQVVRTEDEELGEPDVSRGIAIGAESHHVAVG